MSVQSIFTMYKQLRALYVLCIFVMFVDTEVESQNLVQNGSFEDLSRCPKKLDQLRYARGWFSRVDSLPPSSSDEKTTTPILYAECSSTDYLRPSHISTDNSEWLLAKDGSNFVGIRTYTDGIFSQAQTLGSRLHSPLIRGKSYIISCWIYSRGKPDNFNHSFTDGFGVAVSRDSLLVEVGLTLADLIEVDKYVLSDSVIRTNGNWIRVTTCITANGGEQFIYFGNVIPYGDLALVETDRDVLPKTAILYVDDIKLEPLYVGKDSIVLCTDESNAVDVDLAKSPYAKLVNPVVPGIGITSVGVTVKDNNLGSCVDTVTVIAINQYAKRIDTSICDNSKIVLRAPYELSGIWSTGDTSKSIEIIDPGQYVVSLAADCGTSHVEYNVSVVDCSCDVVVPNVFSPNGDGVNDDLNIIYDCDISVVTKSIRIFDRWGVLMYEDLSGANSIISNSDYFPSLNSGVYVLAVDYIVNGSVNRYTGDIMTMN